MEAASQSSVLGAPAGELISRDFYLELYISHSALKRVS
jgi:hypothetical protein